MTQTVISVRNLDKHYRLGELGARTLREDVDKWLSKLTGKNAGVNTASDRCGGQNRDGQIWAIKNISFEVKQGEILGIIGHNGAGKSTLLKILSSITTPTSGSVMLAGRVGSLLEVGTGFHPELTGRENIFLNGAILGMKREEISKKLDEIIEFSEISGFIDTPIKRYSSGMTVRLAFAVAAHLEPEILLVDEVLSVGDASFQKKCIGKMDEVSGSGRTIIFVSHNLSSVRRLCDRLVVLKKGEMVYDGAVDEGIDLYLEDLQSGDQDMPLSQQFKSDKNIFVHSIELISKRRNAKFIHEDQLRFRIRFQTDRAYNDLELNISFWDKDVKLFMLFGSELTGRGFNQQQSFDAGLHEIIFEYPAELFWAGVYYVSLTLYRPDTESRHQIHSAMTFEIMNNKHFVDLHKGITRGRLFVMPEQTSYKKIQ